MFVIDDPTVFAVAFSVLFSVLSFVAFASRAHQRGRNWFVWGFGACVVYQLADIAAVVAIMFVPGPSVSLHMAVYGGLVLLTFGVALLVSARYLPTRSRGQRRMGDAAPAGRGGTARDGYSIEAAIVAACLIALVTRWLWNVLIDNLMVEY